MMMMMMLLQVDGSHEVRLRLMRPLDRESRHHYSLALSAVDGGRPARSGSILLDVYVKDANDNSPSFDSPVYEVCNRGLECTIYVDTFID